MNIGFRNWNYLWAKLNLFIQDNTLSSIKTDLIYNPSMIKKILRTYHVPWGSWLQHYCKTMYLINPEMMYLDVINTKFHEITALSRNTELNCPNCKACIWQGFAHLPDLLEAAPWCSVKAWERRDMKVFPSLGSP